MKLKFDGEMKRRIAMAFLGIIVLGFSVGLFSLAALGMDPFQVFAHGVWRLTPLTFGTFYTILSALMLVIMFIINRKKIGFGTFINMFFLGYIADFSENLFSKLIPGRDILTRIFMLLAALVITCFASALYMVADMGVSVYDVLSITVSERKKVPFKVCRVISDITCVVIGGALCFISDRDLSPDGALLVTAGVGTVITAFFMGPFIAFFSRTVAEPLRYGKRRPTQNED
ncbi:MAG: hypothetical protein IJ805_01535 [Lachnospiraceae bacterium]|nr:hypothetical protein [Lachnospiraceae bacterium]